MKGRRLSWLVATMVVLAILRLMVPSPGREAPSAVAEAIVRGAPSMAKANPDLASTHIAEIGNTTRGEEPDEPGNAFGVRPPPPAPYVPVVVIAKAKALNPEPVPVPVPVLVPVASEPPLPSAPFQVIGTWDDGKAPGVFLSSPMGTVLARPGMTLQAEYKVNSITPQQISLLQLSTRREIRLAIVRPPETPRPYP